ncbi:MAG TPA: hypothetical protein VFV32_12990 [Acidimicrobiales bacterium]|jgi:hypothetical protein|nr:hypothetical protein [Acidimicrobiales bacterium]
MIDVDAVHADLERLVGIAVDAATSLEELVEVAQAAAAIASPQLLEVVASKLAEEVERALASAGAWEAELTYSKIDAWAQTGHRARLLAEAWAVVAPALGSAPAPSPKRSR